MTSTRGGIVLACGAAALAALGCQEEIRHYQVPKAERQAEESPQEAKVRLLVAMVPHGERTWFFKLMGPAPVVAKHQPEFDQFLQSVRFTDAADKPVDWKAPEGWQRDEGSAKGGPMVQRYATFHVGPKDNSAELTVIALGKEAGSLVANVNRWRGQIGLRPISETELALVSQRLTIDGARSTLVDMSGSGASKTAPMVKGAMPPGHPPANRPSSSPLRYTVPAGWQEQTGSSGFSVAAFAVSEGGRKADVTVSPLGGPAGGLLANVNRWRGQINLGPVNEAQLSKELQEIEVDGAKAAYVDLVGPAEQILAVTVPRGPQTWFIKMRGPADLVRKQKAAFETFVRSIRFTGGKGGEQ